MPKITLHGGVSNAKDAEPVDAPDTDGDEPVDAAPKARRRGRHEAPEPLGMTNPGK
jgi:hypothetical protein